MTPTPCFWRRVETGEVAPAIREKEKEYAINRDPFATVRHNFMVPYRALAERLKDKPYFVNFQNILCSRSEPVYKHDGVHLNDTGRSMVARRLSEVLREKGLGK